MASTVFILFDAYFPEPDRREVHAVFSTMAAADDERSRLMTNGGKWEIEEHELRS